MARLINNSASVTYGYGRSGSSSAASNTVSTTLTEEYSLYADKISLNESFKPGENITYQINLTNEGTNTLYNVTVSDDLGGSTNPLTFLDSSGIVNINGNNFLLIPTSVRPLTFVVPSAMAAGDMVTITYVATVSSSIGNTVSSITNTATITANEGSSTGPVLTVDPSPTNTLPIAEYASVTMTKEVSSTSIDIGQSFYYTITLTNSGNLPASGVVLTDVLPTNFSVSSISSTTNGVTTTYSSSDYTIDSSTNTLTLPTNSAVTISVPAATTSGDGVTTVTITGSITA